jgi:hypothetical protein
LQLSSTWELSRMQIERFLDRGYTFQELGIQFPMT